MIEFINSNKIIDLNFSKLTQKLSLENVYKTLRVLSIDNDKYIDL